MEHTLKTWPVFFADVETGANNFEIRKNDRNFQVGDFLRLEEFEPLTGKYSGDWIKVQINYIVSLDGLPGIPDGYVGMGIEDL